MGPLSSGFRGSPLHPEGFADLWEHARLLSDPTRNEAMVQLLTRHAPGKRVLEVGCGTGLLSVVAAALGAREVLAVEPTEQAELARELVAHAGVSDRVEVVQAAIEELEPRPMDLVFSELLNADPFVEGLLEVSEAAAAWVAEGGHLAPHRLRLFAAAVRAEESHVEATAALRQVRALEERCGVSLGPLVAAMEALEPYPSVHGSVTPAGPPVCVLDLALGGGDEPPELQALRLPVWGDQPLAGATLWFEAQLDHDLLLHNRPGTGGHWGHLVHGWPARVPPRDGHVDVVLTMDDGEIDLRPAASS